MADKIPLIPVSNDQQTAQIPAPVAPHAATTETVVDSAQSPPQQPRGSPPGGPTDGSAVRAGTEPPSAAPEPPAAAQAASQPPPTSEGKIGAKTTHSDSEDEEEDEKKVLEDSPCGRWSKTAAQVKQRDVPGIDVAYLAMDNETGQEVVWNEVQFSERKFFRAQEEKFKAVFANLTQLQHANLVKFHKYWTDAERKTEKPRIVFITEYMSSGSMSQFLKRTKKGNTSLSEKPWKKWCVQILSALSYLHSCEPQIVHGNLSCNTIFIQQNGLIKIGCVAPSAIHHHVKTFRDNMKNMHYIAPEYEVGGGAVTGAADIYAFGICALEMATLGFSANGDGGTTGVQVVTPDLIQKKLDSLENPLVKDFIKKCLIPDPIIRPTARELLFHAILYGVHSLKLLAAHRLVTTKTYDALNIDDFRVKNGNKDRVIAEIKVMGGKGPVHMKYSDVNIIEELDKFVEDVSNGIYPLYAFEIPKKPTIQLRADTTEPAAARTDIRSKSPEITLAGNGPGSAQPKNEQEKDWDPESRRVLRMSADLRAPDAGGEGALLKLMLKLDDQMNRELTTQIKAEEEPLALAADLVEYGFISEDDKDSISKLLGDTMRNYFAQMQQQASMVQQAS